MPGSPFQWHNYFSVVSRTDLHLPFKAFAFLYNQHTHLVMFEFGLDGTSLPVLWKPKYFHTMGCFVLPWTLSSSVIFFQLEVDFKKKLKGQKCNAKLGVNWWGKLELGKMSSIVNSKSHNEQCLTNWITLQTTNVENMYVRSDTCQIKSTLTLASVSLFPCYYQLVTITWVRLRNHCCS